MEVTLSNKKKMVKAMFISFLILIFLIGRLAFLQFFDGNRRNRHRIGSGLNLINEVKTSNNIVLFDYLSEINELPILSINISYLYQIKAVELIIGICTFLFKKHIVKDICGKFTHNFTSSQSNYTREANQIQERKF